MLSTKERIQLYNELMNIIGNSQLPIDTRYLVSEAYIIIKKKINKINKHHISGMLAAIKATNSYSIKVIGPRHSIIY